MIAYVFLATGFEEVEALAPVDILRRSGAEVTMVSITNELVVTGSHGIAITADTTFSKCNFSNAELLVLPGGMPGTANLDAFKPLKELCVEHDGKGRLLAAICAAPRIPGKLGLLEGKNATCYPGNEQYLAGATVVSAPVVVDGNIITANGLGAAVEFGLALVKISRGAEFARQLAGKMMHESR